MEPYNATADYDCITHLPVRLYRLGVGCGPVLYEAALLGTDEELPKREEDVLLLGSSFCYI